MKFDSSSPNVQLWDWLAMPKRTSIAIALAFIQIDFEARKQNSCHSMKDWNRFHNSSETLINQKEKTAINSS